MNDATRASAARMAVHSRLYHLWGERWPVPWEDVYPSVDIWNVGGNTTDEMIGWILDSVEMLRAEGLTGSHLLTTLRDAVGRGEIKRWPKKNAKSAPKN